MNQSEKILLGREERALLIKEYLKDYKTVVSLKANMPGNDKNSYLSYLLISAFSFLISDFECKKHIYNYNDDGPFVIFLFADDKSIGIKQKCIEIEESHPLGRFIDIDVYNSQGSLSRNNKRKCLICNDIAFNCMKINRHSYHEIANVIEKETKDFYYHKLDEIIEESILAELNLEPKFGLVTPNSNGSHPDMNYGLMMKAMNAIKPKIIDIFFESLERKYNNSLLESLRNIGKSAETDMFNATDGVNCYKGLIFNLGIVISAYAIKISRFTSDDILIISKKIAHDLLDDYNHDSLSFGDTAFKKFGILGARGEALSGFKNVKNGINLLQDSNANALLNLLVYYIIHIDDTTLLKRAKDINLYNSVKNMFGELDLNSTEQINILNDFCIRNNLSFGGSADLLVVSVFLKKIANLGINIFIDNNIPKI
jgi:holo-ACP synthase CitX